MKYCPGILMVTFLLMTGCDFLNNEQPDYREKYIGNYSFTINHHFVISVGADSSAWIDTTYAYLGNISIVDSSKEKILVDWGSDTIFSAGDIFWTQKSNLTVDSFGNLTWPEYGDYYRTYFLGGEIKNDIIEFWISWGSIETWGEFTTRGKKN